MGRALTVYDPEEHRVFAITHGRTSSYDDVNLLLGMTCAPRSFVKRFYFYRHLILRRSSTYAGWSFLVPLFRKQVSHTRAPPLPRGADRRIGV